MNRAYYSASIEAFLAGSEHGILGELTARAEFEILPTQTNAWRGQIQILKKALAKYGKRGKIYFEYVIPRLGGRIDAVLVIDHIVFVLEFKVGAAEYGRQALDQVCDYALDLKNFHEPSHAPVIAPILIATEGAQISPEIKIWNDGLLSPLKSNGENLADVIAFVVNKTEGEKINPRVWEAGGYHPTPTIVEAAVALYGNHSVTDISRNDAGAVNLMETSETISAVIEKTEKEKGKAICFVTGVPGSGKTMVGLNIATKYVDADSKLHSVFLSGNSPLVEVLREALALDKIRREKEKGAKIFKSTARNEVKAFIQNVHHFRDDCLKDISKPPIEHVTLFDEAQRAWGRDKMSNFMRRKKGIDGFGKSEPEFLIECMDRHKDWAVIVCLVGGGQEIASGEAGINGWIDALADKFQDWQVYVSSRLTDSEYNAEESLLKISRKVTKRELHLASSMRSFRAENVSLLVKQILDREVSGAQKTLRQIGEKYPIMLTRDFKKAKLWVRENARGAERYGMVVSSNAERLKPYAIDVRPRIKPVNWFLKDKKDVRSSYYLEDVATEFEIQGLELDWACMAWDADFRYKGGKWDPWLFHGDRWKRIRNDGLKTYQKNAYRVLLTRARQGMVIVVPEGDKDDHTRLPDFYDPTFEYLKEIGFQVI